MPPARYCCTEMLACYLPPFHFHFIIQNMFEWIRVLKINTSLFPEYNKTHFRPNISSAIFFHPFCLLVNLKDNKKALKTLKYKVTTLLFRITKGLQVLELDKFWTCHFLSQFSTLCAEISTFASFLKSDSFYYRLKIL